MKKIKKLTVQSVLIAILLFLFYYFGGYYISKEDCIRDTLRSLYAKETDIIMEVNNGNYSVTLVTDIKNHSVSLIGTKRIGFLYQTASASTSKQIDTEEKLYITGFYEKKMGPVFCLYRNDPSIERVEVIRADGTSIILDEWKDNFTVYHFNSDSWKMSTYKAYDASNQLICERVY